MREYAGLGVQLGLGAHLEEAGGTILISIYCSRNGYSTGSIASLLLVYQQPEGDTSDKRAIPPVRHSENNRKMRKHIIPYPSCRWTEGVLHLHQVVHLCSLWDISPMQYIHCKILRRMPQKHILVFRDASKTHFSVSRNT